MFQPGQMMDRPLLISGIIEHAAAQFGNVEVVARETHGPLFRYTWADCAVRSRRLANALKALGLGPGSAVGSIAWNNHRHLEAYFAVSGSGMVMHTCNPRLQAQQLIYIINHAQDEVVLFDTTFAPLVKGIAAHCPKVKAWVCLSDGDNTVAVDGVANVLCYEDLIAAHDDQFDWPDFDERTGAALCYTSGTTGHPKGALLTHGSLTASLSQGRKIGEDWAAWWPSDVSLVAMPLFHIGGTAWVMQTLNGGGTGVILAQPDVAVIIAAVQRHGITKMFAVPAVLNMILNHPDAAGADFSSMRVLPYGASPIPLDVLSRSMQMFPNAQFVQRYGATETSGTIVYLPPEDHDVAGTPRMAGFRRWRLTGD